MTLLEYIYRTLRNKCVIVPLAVLLILAGGFGYYVLLNRQYYARRKAVMFVGTSLVSYMRTNGALPTGWDELIAADHFRREGESLYLGERHPLVEEGVWDSSTPVRCAEAVRFRASVDGKLVPFILEVDDGVGARYGPIEGYWEQIEAARTRRVRGETPVTDGE